TSKYVETVAGRGYRFIAPVDAPVDAAAKAKGANPPTLAQAPLRQKRLHWTWPAVALLFVAATGVTIWSLPRRTDATLEQMTNLIRLTSDTGLAMTPALSEDGKLI